MWLLTRRAPASCSSVSVTSSTTAATSSGTSSPATASCGSGRWTGPCSFRAGRTSLLSTPLTWCSCTSWSGTAWTATWSRRRSCRPSSSPVSTSHTATWATRSGQSAASRKIGNVNQLFYGMKKYISNFKLKIGWCVCVFELTKNIDQSKLLKWVCF